MKLKKLKKPREDPEKRNQIAKFLKSDGNEIDVEAENLRRYEEEKRKREEMRDKRLNGFLATMKRLREKRGANFDEELKIFIDEEIDKLDYSEEKKIELRKNSFYSDLEFMRNTTNSIQNFLQRRIQYHSPVKFFINSK